MADKEPGTQPDPLSVALLLGGLVAILSAAFLGDASTPGMEWGQKIGLASFAALLAAAVSVQNWSERD